MNNIIHQLMHRGLLNALITADDKGSTISSLAKLSGVPYATAWRMIKSLEKTGALKIRKVGAVCLVFPDRTSGIWDNLKKVTHIEADLSSLKKEFEFISRDVVGVLLYGSHANGTADKRSDIDICIVKPRNCKVMERMYSKLGDKYDIKIFEDLPMYLKKDVIDKYKVIFGNEPEISYYFYGFRKLGQDMKHRILVNQFGSAREMVITRRRWLDSRRQIFFKD